MEGETTEVNAIFNTREHSLPKVSNFSGEGEDVLMWIERFEQIMAALNMKEKEMFPRLPVYLEGVARSWYFSRAKPGRNGAPTNYKELRNALIGAFIPADYRNQLQTKLRTKIQQPNQSVKTYIYEMTEIAYRIDAESPDQFIIATIKEGLLPGIEMFLNVLPHDTMESFVDSCIKAEKSYQSSVKVTNLPSYEKTRPIVTTCNYCSRRGHNDTQCFKKQRDNERRNEASHSRDTGNVSAVVQDIQWGDAWATTLTTNPIKTNKLITAKIRLHQLELQAMIDTGAEISIIKMSSLHNAGIEIKPYTGPPTYVADRRRFFAAGECTLSFILITETRPVTIMSKLMVAKELPCAFDLIIGQDILRAVGGTIDLANGTLSAPLKAKENVTPTKSCPFNHNESTSEDESDDSSTENSENNDNVKDSEESDDYDEDRFQIANVTLEEKVITRSDLNIPTTIDDNTSNKLLEISNNYRDIFAFKDEDIKESNLCKHSIDTGNAKPIYQQPYRQSFHKQQLARGMIQQLMKLNIIRPSKSPWSSPVVLVPKKTGDTRMAIDYRKINSVTKPDRHPLPDIGLVLDSLQGTTVYTSLDLRQGYYQIAMEEADKEKTAFTTLEGLYEFNRMPFGLINAPATFQRMMNRVLDGILYKFTMVYLDDIIIYSKTMEEHFTHITEVFDRLQASGLTLKPTKCDFLQSSILFLGYIIDKNGQKPDPNKVKVIKEIPPPTDLTTLRRFLGMASFYRKFIENFAKIAEPLHRLTKKVSPYIWTEEQQTAFEKIKDKLINHPVLRHYNPQDKTQVRCDASDIGISAIILQEDESGYRPVAFASRLLRGSELNYTIADRECLAIIFAVQKFRPYLEGVEFEIITDNCALCFLQSKNKLPPRLMRYSMLLQEFYFKIIYKSGKTHLDADALSRLFPNTLNNGQHSEEISLLTREEQVEENDKENKNSINKENENENEKEKENWISFVSQQADTYCLDLIDQITRSTKLTQRQKKQLRKFTYENGYLYRIIKTPYGTRKLLLTPKDNQLEIIEMYHNSSLGGHFGVQKTLENIRTKYFWKSMAKDVVEYIQSCEACQKTKDEHRPARGELIPINTTRPFHKIGLDFVGPLIITNADNRYILVCTDLFTRWAETKPTKNCTSKTVAEFLFYNILLRHGAPEEVISDRGRAFINKTLGLLIRIMNSKQILTTAYHPMGNGAVERVNRIISQILSTLVYKKSHQWDTFLPMATFAYNCSKNSSTQASPFFLLYGRDPRLPENFKVRTQDYGEMVEYVEYIKKDWPQVREIASELSYEAKIKAKDQHDVHRLPDEFETGNEVLLRKLPLRNSMGERFEGPFTILKKKSPVNYVIQRKRKKENIHIERLKPYHRVTNNLMTIFLLLIVMSPCILGIFEKVPPIVWRKQTKNVAKGQYDIQLRIFLDNPCNHLISNDSQRISKRSIREPETCGEIVRQYLNFPNTYIKLGNRMSYPTEDFCQQYPVGCQMINKYLREQFPQKDEALIDETITNQTIYYPEPPAYSPPVYSYTDHYSSPGVLPDPSTRFMHENQTTHTLPGDTWYTFWETSLHDEIIEKPPYIYTKIYDHTYVQLRKNNYTEKMLGDSWGVFPLGTNSYTLGMKLSFKNSKDTAIEAKNKLNENLRRKCQDTYETMFETPLKSLCQSRRRNRQKRLIPLVLAMAVLALPGIISVGLGTVNAITNLQKSEELVRLHKMGESLVKRDSKVRDAILTLQQSIITLSEKYSQLEPRVSTLEKLLPEFTFASGILVNKLSRFRQVFNTLETSPTNPENLAALLYEFNVSLPCGKECPLKLARNFYCEHTDNQLDIFFSISGIDPNKLVVQADPFIPQTTNSTNICSNKYVGPTNMIVDVNSGQNCPLSLYEEEQLKRSDTELITFSGIMPESCETGENIAKKTDLWEIVDCRNKSKDTRNAPQVKFTSEYIYIYCLGFNITLFGKSQPCPDSAFKMSHNSNFTVGNIKHVVQKFELYARNTFESNDMLNYIANLAVSQSIPALIEPIQLDEWKEEDKTWLENLPYPSQNPITYTISLMAAMAITFVVIRITVCILLIYWRKCFTGTTNKNSSGAGNYIY